MTVNKSHILATNGLRSPARRGVLGIMVGSALGLLANLLETSVAAPGKDTRQRRRKRRQQRRRESGQFRFPDLRTQQPSELRFDLIDSSFFEIEGGVYVIRFTNTIWNAGEGRLELQGDPQPDEEAASELFQNLYDKPAGGARVRRRQVNGEILYHPTHAHYHFADFASYLLLKRDNADDYQPMGEGTKTSFCITDNYPVAGAASDRQYQSCERVLQGLTPGWADTYRYDLPEQWVEIGPEPLPDGEYGLQSTADPRALLDEGGGAGETNNAATAYFSVVLGQIRDVRATPNLS